MLGIILWFSCGLMFGRCFCLLFSNCLISLVWVVRCVVFCLGRLSMLLLGDLNMCRVCRLVFIGSRWQVWCSVVQVYWEKFRVLSVWWQGLFVLCMVSSIGIWLCCIIWLRVVLLKCLKVFWWCVFISSRFGLSVWVCCRMLLIGWFLNRWMVLFLLRLVFLCLSCSMVLMVFIVDVDSFGLYMCSRLICVLCWWVSWVVWVRVMLVFGVRLWVIRRWWIMVDFVGWLCWFFYCCVVVCYGF